MEPGRTHTAAFSPIYIWLKQRQWRTWRERSLAMRLHLCGALNAQSLFPFGQKVVNSTTELQLPLWDYCRWCLANLSDTEVSKGAEHWKLHHSRSSSSSGGWIALESAGASALLWRLSLSNVGPVLSSKACAGCDYFPFSKSCNQTLPTGAWSARVSVCVCAERHHNSTCMDLDNWVSRGINISWYNSLHRGVIFVPV